jgi:DNA-binding phage protein
MKDKASISHDEAMSRELRENPDFAAEYLRAAMEDEAEPRVLLVALRRVAESRGLARVAKDGHVRVRARRPRHRVEEGFPPRARLWTVATNE